MNDDNEVTPGDAEGGAPASGAGPDEGAGADSPEDALRSLERLEALSRGETPAPVRPAPPPRRGGRPRVAAASRPAQGWARIAAPVVFLVAVIIVVALAFQSGVVGGGKEEPTPAPKPSKSATKSPKPSKSPTASAKPSAKPSATASGTPAGTTVTKVYVVKTGDTLSGIAARYSISVVELEELNVDRDLTTLQPGEKLNVPAQ